jgi:hypothetical protein
MLPGNGTSGASDVQAADTTIKATMTRPQAFARTANDFTNRITGVREVVWRRNEPMPSTLDFGGARCIRRDIGVDRYQSKP